MNLLPSLRGRRRRPTTSHVTASSIFRKITAPDIFDKACEIALQYGQCKYGYIKNLVQSKCSGFESMQEEPVGMAEQWEAIQMLRKKQDVSLNDGIQMLIQAEKERRSASKTARLIKAFVDNVGYFIVDNLDKTTSQEEADKVEFED